MRKLVGFGGGMTFFFFFLLGICNFITFDGIWLEWTIRMYSAMLLIPII